MFWADTGILCNRIALLTRKRALNDTRDSEQYPGVAVAVRRRAWSEAQGDGEDWLRGPDRYFVRVNWPTLVMPRRKKSAHPVKYRM